MLNLPYGVGSLFNLYDAADTHLYSMHLAPFKIINTPWRHQGQHVRGQLPPSAVGSKNPKDKNQSVHQLGNSDGCRLSVQAAANHPGQRLEADCHIVRGRDRSNPALAETGMAVFYPARFFWIVLALNQ